MKRSILPVIISCLLTVLPLLSHATKITKDKLEPIKKVIRGYNSTSSVKMGVNKSVYMALMGETKKSEGDAIYSQGRLRLKMNAPEDSLIVMDKSTIWIVTPGPEEGKPQVSKIIAKDLKNQSRAPLAILLSREDAWSEFKIVKSEPDGDGKRFFLEPKDPQKWPDLRKISLTVAKDGKSLVQLSYEDELENKTEFAFKNIVTDQKLSAGTFKYAPPPGAEVQVYK